MFMKNMCLLPVWAVLLIIAGTFFSCEKKKDMAIYRQADSLNLLSYRMRYKIWTQRVKRRMTPTNWRMDSPPCVPGH